MRHLFLVVFMVSLFVPLLLLGQDCSIKFTSHKTGSVINSNGRKAPVSISGTATVPIGGHLWILSHLQGFDGWWPQGLDERRPTDRWTCAVFLGEAGETGNYEIAAIVVNDNENQALKNWVSTAQANGYPPIAFPNIINECGATIITVEKK